MIPNNSSVNYIKHLTEVFSRFTEEEKLSAYHISLYVALFQIWNMNRFQNPFIIYRSEIMLISRIGSKSTYHRCLCDLEKFGYLNYFPSKNAFVGSKIEIISFDNCSPMSGTDLGHQKEPSSPMGSTNVGQPCPTGGHQKEPINKHIKHNKHINITIEQNEFCQAEKQPKKKVKNSSFEVPKLENVIEYFKAKKQSEIEAHKFFNYFESNGWKVGGRTPMKNWHASANNWILNSEKYKNNLFQPKRDNLHTNQNKDYSIPL
ncbi:MAG: transcriptional regulator [Flavobacteriia bacterium]|nr:transcriptional regulator [Flavobacteriia bacterium]